jgi:hypothetical protein
MSRECYWLRSCAFFQDNKDLEHEEVNQLIKDYCKGPSQEQCIRKIYYEIYGRQPDSRMNPKGKKVGSDE